MIPANSDERGTITLKPVELRAQRTGMLRVWRPLEALMRASYMTDRETEEVDLRVVALGLGISLRIGVCA